MWPFKKQAPNEPPPEPPSPPKEYYNTTSLQIGDECVCKDDSEHSFTHQKLLSKGEIYKVRDVNLLGKNKETGCLGPWIKLEGVRPIADNSWNCKRFEKVIKQEKKESILTKVLEPTELDIEKEKQEAY